MKRREFLAASGGVALAGWVPIKELFVAGSETILLGRVAPGSTAIVMEFSRGHGCIFTSPHDGKFHGVATSGGMGVVKFDYPLQIKKGESWFIGVEDDGRIIAQRRAAKGAAA